jgi:DmsE family decaheme c-type cytochrome
MGLTPAPDRLRPNHPHLVSPVAERGPPLAPNINRHPRSTTTAMACGLPVRRGRAPRTDRGTSMMNSEAKRLLRPVPLLVFALALLWPPPVAAEDWSDCAACHENLGRQFETTVHGRIQSFEVHSGQVGCVTCHGDGQAHMDAGGDPALIRGLGDKTEPEQTAEVCMACHRSRALHDWVGGVHPMNGVGCSDCHKIHANPGKIARYSETCMDCHTEVQAQFTYPSHHPVLEGHMTCDSCHDPHGTSVGMLRTEERPQDLCYSCHRDLQGPFVFEHEPVFEGCDVCHAPHGAVASRLLLQTEPFLCLQCHEFHFHAGLEGEEDTEAYVPAYDPDFDPGNQPRPTYPGGMVPNPGRGASYKMAFTTKCTQCHTQVHGSDTPAQTVAGYGDGLTR